MQELWEEEIIDWLKGKINYCTIDAFPENPERFVKHKIGNILVRYSSIKWDQEDISEGYQKGKVNIEIVLLFRKLRGKQGLYDAVNDIRIALYNQRPTRSANQIQFESEDLLEVEQGIWQYGIKVGFDCYYIPDEENTNQVVATTVTTTTEAKHCE